LDYLVQFFLSATPYKYNETESIYEENYKRELVLIKEVK